MANRSSPRVAVVTGGHSFDVVHFHQLFRTLGDVEPYVQHLDDFAATAEAERDAYDVVVFYLMMMQGPTDAGLPWYAGKPKTALEHLGATNQGVLVLHHALLAYPQWPVWDEVVGVSGRQFGYYNNQSLHLEVVNPEHPITRGLAAWDMVDETYTMADAGAGSEILLSVAHPRSMKHLAWTRQYRQARVFCFQSGHDNVTWADVNFREVLRRGILWCAHRL